MLSLIIPVKPVSLNNAYGTNKYGRRYLKEHGQVYKNAISLFAKVEMRRMKYDLFQDPICVQIEFFYPDLKKRDIDNSIKLTLDSLTGICFKDDSEIAKLIIGRNLDREHPRVEIIITQL